MRADRLISLVLLLRRRGRCSARTLADELEVSTRTVLRDIEALSSAGVPVYAERGRHGGFALLPGFRAELSGLNHDESLALLAVGSGRDGPTFGFGPALASAMRKVADALPETHRTSARDAARRFLVDPDTDLLPRRPAEDELPATAMSEVRDAVLAGRRLRLHYAAPDTAPRWRTVDPIGLVTVHERGYLLATRDGADRTYRLSRILAAEALPVPAQRPADVDLDRAWRDRCARFLAHDHLVVRVRVEPTRREELVRTAVAVRADDHDGSGRPCLAVTFQDARHAVWALWQLGDDVEALDPPSLRAALRDRAAALVRRYSAASGKPVVEDRGREPDCGP